jgi:predicted phage tail protein
MKTFEKIILGTEMLAGAGVLKYGMIYDNQYLGYAGASLLVGGVTYALARIQKKKKT